MDSLDICLLEEDDMGGLFLTQESRSNTKNVGEDMEEEEGTFLGLSQTDFQSPCKSMLAAAGRDSAIYSDISDEEFVENKSTTQEIVRSGYYLICW